MGRHATATEERRQQHAMFVDVDGLNAAIAAAWEAQTDNDLYKALRAVVASVSDQKW